MTSLPLAVASATLSPLIRSAPLDSDPTAWTSCPLFPRISSRPLDHHRAAPVDWAVRVLNSALSISAVEVASGGLYQVGRSDHLFSPQISDPTVPIESQPDRPFRIQRAGSWARDLWPGSTHSGASGPSRFAVADWWPLAHLLVIFSPAPRACSCARAEQRGKQRPVPSAWSFLDFCCNAFNAHRAAAPEVFPVSSFTCSSHSWQQRGPVSFLAYARCYSAYLSS